ncbi:hypothetical protein [Nonomuraea rubra]|uniref:Uncharacterized protein n=1 Tax=Nonomuraea rubra TaxID=46180 RepID=A0A7X0NSH6_9ACTN|nr:hypothetical protein [Nonomuraea rubra]MBB6548737.1 hypothetical protein [Nonomuraea rubra]
MESSWISRGVTAAAMAGITLLSTTPASAASYWNSSAPTAATSVRNTYEKSVTIGSRTFTIQLRVGKWGSNTYFWARAPKDSHAYGAHLYISVYNPSTKKWESRSEALNKKTAYTDAHRSLYKYGYKACASDSMIGSRWICTSTWWV